MITFHELYQRYEQDVFRFAYWLSSNRAEAEDIASETFVRAWAGRHKIRTHSVKAYLFTIARNLYLHSQRNAYRYEELSSEQINPELGPLDVVSHLDEIESIHKALQTISEVDRAAFLMRILDELPYAEIAGALSISISSAKVKVHRTRIKLITLKEDHLS